MVRTLASKNTLERFLQDCRELIDSCQSPADCVATLSPLMFQLLKSHKTFLKPHHLLSHPDRYERNAIYIDKDNQLSLFAIVWLPGQWTPIHDHGTWGLVGVLEGVLEERNYIRVDRQINETDKGIELVRGGVTMLTPGAVTSFVPNPDHIHITGNSHSSQRIISLHLYGHAMAGFNTYDIETKSRHWTDVRCNQSSGADSN